MLILVRPRSQTVGDFPPLCLLFGLLGRDVPLLLCSTLKEGPPEVPLLLFWKESSAQSIMGEAVNRSSLCEILFGAESELLSWKVWGQPYFSEISKSCFEDRAPLRSRDRWVYGRVESVRSWQPFIVSGGGMDGDDVSLENLQAQIDMSMSFAQSLVSTWVKPRQSGRSKRKLELENDLLEATRRRPRLGVGAAVIEANATPHDNGRLKSQLVGKQRERHHEEAETTTKKKGGLAVLSAASTSREPTVGRTPGVNPGSIKLSLTQPEPDSTKSQKNKPPGVAASFAHGLRDEDPAMGTDEVRPPNSQSQRNAEEEWAGRDVCEELSATSPVLQRDLSQVSSPGIRLASSIRPGDLPADLLKQPLLNLREISDDSDSEHDNKSAVSSPKKKRRRRKKKKKTATDALASPPAAPSSEIKLLIS
ncbi:hypothetical protein NMY22_g11098 [Coprinellus aureogranulatus]|nr:hypothetical protein NMY22_g11098 [Coprinellus aureogranulatus]